MLAERGVVALGRALAIIMPGGGDENQTLETRDVTGNSLKYLITRVPCKLRYIKLRRF